MAEDNGCFLLNTGAIIPSVGLGTFDSEPGVVGDAVTAAVKLGYRHIDCARVYRNEKEIGAALKKLLEDGVVKRQDLWITSKLWCSDHAPEDVAKAAEATLHDLQLDYLDLYLIHWPARSTKGEGYEKSTFTLPDTPATWRAMEELFYAGKARAIGVSNFSSKKLGELLEVARVTPAVNQVECNPFWQQEELRAFCRLKGVHLSGYSPLGTPGWAKKNVQEWEKRIVMKHPVVNTVAEKVGKTAAQVALRWGLQMGHSILPKSSKEARIKENWDVFNWSIPQNLMNLFSQIEQEKVVKGALFVDQEHGPYKTLDELWDGEI